MKKKKPVVIAGYFSRIPTDFVSLLKMTVRKEDLSQAHHHSQSPVVQYFLRPQISK
jgi:hypothetical protein